MKLGKPNFMDDFVQRFGSLENAVVEIGKAVPQNPVNARIDLQVLLNALGREEEAFKMAEELIKLAPEDPRVLFNRGWHILKRGRLLEGLGFLENGRRISVYGHQALQSRSPVWRPEIGYGHRVHLVLEGGFGDEIIHVRAAKVLAEKYDCKVNIVCHPSLAGVFSRMPWASALLQREAALGVYHDSWLPGMSSALALGQEYQDLSGKPYLTADHGRLQQWGGLLRKNKSEIKIGIRWAGNPQFEHQQLRSFPPDILLNLRNLDPRIRLYSFQRDDNLIDLPSDIVDLGPMLKDWDDTAAALSQMDLVITSCTSVAHMSAALGLKTWVLVPALPYFIWALPGRTSPWYDTVHLFRQAAYGSWENVRQQLSEEVGDWIKKR